MLHKKLPRSAFRSTASLELMLADEATQQSVSSVRVHHTERPSHLMSRVPTTVTVASRVSLIFSDVIVLVTTWTVTHAYRNQDILHGFGRTTTLAGVLYKNGAFALMRVCKSTCIRGLTCTQQGPSTSCELERGTFSSR